MLTEKEIELLQLARDMPHKYKFIVDNDIVWLERVSPTRDGENYEVGSFDSYGIDLIYNLLEYLDCNVEYC